MISQRYRIKTPIIALTKVDGLYTTMYASVGEIVTVMEALDGVRIIEVKWRGTTALMFTVELRNHAELVQGAASGDS